MHLLAGEGVWGRGRHLSPLPQQSRINLFAVLFVLKELRRSPSFGPKFSLRKVDRCLQYIVDRSLLLGCGSVSFHRPSFLSFLLLFSFFVPRSSFPQRNFVPGSPRNDDRQRGRPTHTLLCPSSSAFHFPKVDRRWRLIPQRLMRAFVIAEAPPFPRFHFCSVSEAAISNTIVALRDSAEPDASICCSNSSGDR